MTYDALWRPTAVAWGHGLTTSSVFGANERLSTLQVTGPGSTHLSHTYQYDLAGNTERLSEDASGWHRDFTYDWANRLLTASHFQGQTLEKAWTWQYAPNGNMTYNSDWAGGGLDGS